MEEAITRIVTELEDLRHLENPTNTQSQPISDSTLSDLQTLFDANDRDPMDRFSDELAAKSLSLSNLVRPIVAAMDSSPPLSADPNYEIPAADQNAPSTRPSKRTFEEESKMFKVVLNDHLEKKVKVKVKDNENGIINFLKARECFLVIRW